MAANIFKAFLVTSSAILLAGLILERYIENVGGFVNSSLRPNAMHQLWPKFEFVAASNDNIQVSSNFEATMDQRFC